MVFWDMMSWLLVNGYPYTPYWTTLLQIKHGPYLWHIQQWETQKWHENKSTITTEAFALHLNCQRFTVIALRNFWTYSIIINFQRILYTVRRVLVAYFTLIHQFICSLLCNKKQLWIILWTNLKENFLFSFTVLHQNLAGMTDGSHDISHSK